MLVPIQNCKRYMPDRSEICLVCASGTIISRDGTSCDPVPSSGNCVAFNYYDCDSCSKEFYYDPNAYIFEFISDNDLVFEYMQDVHLEVFNSKIGKFCRPKLDQNCEVRISNTNCLECKSGFFRNKEGLCEQIPQESLENCRVYKGEGICEECHLGFYLDKNLCKVSEKVSNCERYSKDQNKCVRCSDSHYLNDRAKCVERVASSNDPHCSRLTTNADSCDQCEEFHLIDSNNRCVAGISQCESYSGTLDDLACSQCIDTYFFNPEQKWCEQPLSFATSPCLKYGDSEDECRECKSGFYLDTVCKNHLNLDSKCQVSSKTTSNKCEKCNDGFALFTNKKICKPVDTIDQNCLRWRSATECDLCSPGFQAPNCELIPFNENCLFKEEGSSECSTCRNGFFKNEQTNGVCVTAHDFEKFYCEGFSLADDSSLVQCEYCVKGKFFMEFDGFFGCEYRSNYPDMDNCEMVDVDLTQGTQTCLKCKEGKFLEDGECIDACPEEKVFARTTVSIDAANDNRLGIKSLNTCEENTDNNFDNCEMIVPAVDAMSNKFVCAKCKEGFVKVYDLKESNVTFSYNVEADHYDDVIVREGAFQCKQLDMIPDYSSDQCAVYGEASTGKHGCIRCNFGYTGNVKKPIEDEDVYFIKQCSSMPDCNPSDDSVLGMTTPKSLSIWKIPIETFISCIECTGTDQMPVVLIRQNENEPISPIWYNLLNYVATEIPNTHVSDKDSFGVVSNCLNTSVGAQYGFAEDFKVTYPNDCALLLYRVDRDPNENLEGNEPTVYCAACDRGFRVEERGGVPGDLDVVRKCQRIENCNQSTWYNYCSVCEAGHVYRFDPASKTIEYDYCIKSTEDEDNCLAMEEGKKCVVCRKGFSFNDEGICEDFNFANCESSLFLSRDSVYRGHISQTSIFDLSLVLHFHGTSNLGSARFGCSKCTDDFVSVSGLPSSGHCVDSPYIHRNKFNELRFISNCVKFGWDYENKKHLCRECIPGFMPNYTLTKCVQKLDYCNRASANGERFCHECQDGFSLIKSRCVLNDINNCLEYGVENNQLVCIQCTNEYYLYQKKFCLQGKIQNCLHYEDNDSSKCLRCKDQYASLIIQTGESICVPFENQNCAFWNSSSSNGNFECTECEANYFVDDVSPEYRSEICLGPMTIDNCLQVSASIDETNILTFTCLECENNYFEHNSGTACLLLDQVDDCLEYSTSQNKCLKCKEGFFLEYTGKKCFEFPKGIYGCEVYLSLTECLKCQENKYLNNGNCIDIEPIDWIENCRYYSSLEKCVECESGYFLEKNKCHPSRARNCGSYASETACDSCPKNYGFIEEEGVTNCTIINSPNCIKSTHVYPFKCILCSKGFYQLRGDCYPAEKIVNCEYYLANKICMTCKKGFVRSWDGKKCQKIGEIIFPVDEQCTSSFLAPKLICVACRPGYFLSEGTCKECGRSGNCMFCDPDDSTRCLVCLPGTVMNEEGACEGEPLASFRLDELQGKEEVKNSGKVKKAGLRNALVFLLIGLLWTH